MLLTDTLRDVWIVLEVLRWAIWDINSGFIARTSSIICYFGQVWPAKTAIWMLRGLTPQAAVAVAASKICSQHFFDNLAWK